MPKTKVHVISHTHWDREWYFTTSRSTIYLIKHVKEVLETLENDPDFSYYLLDAQASLIEDYLKYCPEDEPRIQKLVTAGKLLTGPWYTQTDQLVISQESVVRNLYYGTEIAKKLGNYMKIGYVPDAFGQGGNLPQVYKQFGIERFLFWRGVADNRNPHTEFIWQGNDGTKMLANQLPFGYYYGGNIPEEQADILPYLNQQIGALEAKATTRHIYFPNGFDQAPLRKNLPELIKKFNEIDAVREYVLDSPEAFFDELEQDVQNLPVLTGELTQAKHSRIHKSIFSGRSDLKQQNNELENLLVNTVEPVLSISYSLGNRYPHGELAEIWKLLFENAAHDSIGGCNSDTTNRDVAHRYKLAKDKAENLLDLHMRLVSAKIPLTKEINLTVFNPLVYSTSQVIEVQVYLPGEDFSIKNEADQPLAYTIKDKVDVTEYVLNQTILLNPSKKIYLPKKVYLATLLVEVPNLPALGYQTLSLHLGETAGFSEEQLNADVDTLIENDYYKVELAPNNTVTITEKSSGKVYKDQAMYEENGDDGDSYNYSPPRNDQIIRSTEGQVVHSEIKKSAIEQTLTFTIELKVPQDLAERAAGLATGKMTVTTKIQLKKATPIIDFQTKIENHVTSHRLCVLFATGIASKVSTADQLFGTIQRPVRLPELDVWEAEKWEEIPNAIEPMQTYVALHEENVGAVVLTKGVREYEISGEKYDTIRLTLFRTFGFMGKENLVYRPGRASGESIVATPDAQLLGEINCHFGYYLFSDQSFDDAQIGKLSKEYHTTFPVYETADFLNGRLIYAYREEEKTNQPTYSVADFGAGDALVATVKKAEKEEALLVRFYNPYIEKIAKLPEWLVKEARQVLVDEETETPQKTTLQPCQFTTLLVEKQK